MLIHVVLRDSFNILSKIIEPLHIENQRNKNKAQKQHNLPRKHLRELHAQPGN